METFDRNWRELQLETLVDLSLTIGGVLSEEELVEELLQRAVGTLDAGSGLVSTLHPGGQEAVVRSVRLPQSIEAVRAWMKGWDGCRMRCTAWECWTIRLFCIPVTMAVI